ncbi:MAG: amidase domain-containing protein, partial [Clostridia bacterium]|nr:amidase domain-containing protein [Clostridia bacterium]
MPTIPYNRLAAVRYARKWALSRNPMYYNFDETGGDCTNFASQCIYAGAGVMNFGPLYGWY